MANESLISQAFILGAGLGTRLRPLTNYLPKPLVPVWNAPLISFAFDHLLHDLGTRHFMVNTHHAAEKYDDLFQDKTYRGCRLEFRHEEVLLDTAGGLDNIRDGLPEDAPFLVYNGDILTDLPLAPAVKAHHRSGNLVTLILRTDGVSRNVAFNTRTGKVTDMRNALQTHSTDLFQFTGIYVVSPRFLSYLKPGKIESIVFPFLKAIQNEQKVGGVVVDTGYWSDLGDVPSYLAALDLLVQTNFPSFGLEPNKCRIHPTAKIHETAVIDSLSSIGAEATIGAGTEVTRSVIWPQAVAGAGEKIVDRVVLPY